MTSWRLRSVHTVQVLVSGRFWISLRARCCLDSGARSPASVEDQHSGIVQKGAARSRATNILYKRHALLGGDHFNLTLFSFCILLMPGMRFWMIDRLESFRVTPIRRRSSHFCLTIIITALLCFDQDRCYGTQRRSVESHIGQKERKDDDTCRGDTSIGSSLTGLHSAGSFISLGID